MGADPREDGGRKRNTRGSTNNNKRLAGLTQRSKQSNNADWGSVDPRWLAGIVVACTRRGMSPSFMLSRDGGAYGLAIYDGSERTVLWFNGDADLEHELSVVYDYIEALPE